VAYKRWEEDGRVVEERDSGYGKAVFVDGVEVNETFGAAVRRVMAEESLKKLLNPKNKS
jgi:hypothetical protein